MRVAEHQSRTTRVQIVVRGIVQGVGFRPFVYSLAARSALRGQVLNNTTGVLIDVEGEDEAIERFINEITLNPPPLSQIESIQRHNNLDSANYHDFRIVESAQGERNSLPSRLMLRPARTACASFSMRETVAIATHSSTAPTAARASRSSKASRMTAPRPPCAISTCAQSVAPNTRTRLTVAFMRSRQRARNVGRA